MLQSEISSLDLLSSLNPTILHTRNSKLYYKDTPFLSGVVDDLMKQSQEWQWVLLFAYIHHEPSSPATPAFVSQI